MNRMNLRKTLTAAILIGGTVLGASALADPPQGAYGHGVMGGDGQGPGMMGGHGPGMMGGGPGMMGGRGPGMMGGGAGMMGMTMYAALDLTDEQRAKVARIFEEMRKKNWDAMGKVMDETAILRDLYNAPTHDPAAIGRQTVKIAEMKRPIIESMVTAHDQVDALLTTEQKGRLRSLGRGWMMPGE